MVTLFVLLLSLPPAPSCCATRSAMTNMNHLPLAADRRRPHASNDAGDAKLAARDLDFYYGK